MSSKCTATRMGSSKSSFLSPTESRIWAAGLPLQGIKRWYLSGEDVYARQCRLRISSCSSSKHNNFMLTKSITSFTHKTPHKVRKTSLLLTPWLLWPLPWLRPVSSWNVFFFEAQVVMALSTSHALWPVTVTVCWFEVMDNLPLHFGLEWLIGFVSLCSF